MERHEVIERIKLLKALIGYTKTEKILTTFITAFENFSILKEDGIYYLHGNFNLGGTKSGRLSSSKPNLQQIPSHSTYAKLIKSCFVAPPGYLMGGADFNSLEDMISALTTKDPNKLKVYTDGYDGHSLRAYSYFPDDLNGVLNSVDGINSIEDNYPDLRQASKGPTFALTYGGTHYALIYQCGLTKEDAIRIESAYHEMYQVSDQWVNTKLHKASSDGYVTVAFGLRLRTPVLQQTLFENAQAPYASMAEGRTAGNALGQSYGLLTNRAANEFMDRVRKSKYALSIRMIAQIHDAIYLLMENRVGCIEWVNANLIDCMKWQELPDIQHETVKLGAQTIVNYPSWESEIKIPNDANKRTILDILNP